MRRKRRVCCAVLCLLAELVAPPSLISLFLSHHVRARAACLAGWLVGAATKKGERSIWNWIASDAERCPPVVVCVCQSIDPPRPKWEGGPASMSSWGRRRANASSATFLTATPPLDAAASSRPRSRLACKMTPASHSLAKSVQPHIPTTNTQEAAALALLDQRTEGGRRVDGVCVLLPSTSFYRVAARVDK